MYARNDKPPIITNQYGMLYAILSLIIGFNKHIIRGIVHTCHANQTYV